MRKTRFVVLLVVLGTLGAVVAFSSRCSAAEEKTFFDRLDDFGKSIFDGILPPKKSKPKSQITPAPDDRRSDRWQDHSDPSGEVGAPRAGSVLEGRVQRPSEQVKPSGAPYGEPSDIRADRTPKTMPPVYERGEDGLPRPVRRPLAGTSLLGDEGPSDHAAGKAEAAVPQKAAGKPTELFGDPTDFSGPSQPETKPLHKRLADFSRSVFGTGESHDRTPQPNFQPERTEKPSLFEGATVRTPESQRPAGRPVIAQRTAAGERPTEALPLASVPEVAAEAQPANDRRDPETARDGEKTENEVLFARKGPILSVETFGPRTISVGRESTYEVHVINLGTVAAEGLTVYVSLPEWAEASAAEAGEGTAQTAEINRKDGSVQWNVGSLEAKDRRRLTLKVIPRQSRPFDLAVRWDYKPVASQASIEVQEPKLVMQLEGPSEVYYGKKEVFQLKLANTGTGDAENVAVTLTPIGTGENVQASHKIGVLAAGEKKTLEVELTARQAGHLSIQVDARADGNLHVELAEKVLVRRGGLQIEFEGPKVQFVGTAGIFNVRVVNPGNAPARNVEFELALPEGAKYLSGIDGAKLNSAGDKLLWTLDKLEAQEEQRFALRCRMTAAGMTRLRLNAVADDDLKSGAETVVQVESVANLTMDVKDPAGPTPIGEETLYEVRVKNRGTNEARNVEVFVYFSRGIEPIAAEGLEGRLAPGQVVFQPIPALAPGAEVVLKVRARAETAGNHVFRAETHCKPLAARLISEATNLYYGDTPAVEQTAREPASEATR